MIPAYPDTNNVKRRVYCSQFAQCGWAGYRIVKVVGTQPAPCPKCGREVLA